jgi:tetratricopeptide (TPR) repeat protein
MDELGRYAEALTYYFESLKLEELMGNKRGQAITLGNIGIIYYDQKEYNKALDYYQKSYELKKEMNEVGSISTTLGNMGVVYHDQNNLEKALEYYRKALAADKQHNNQQGVARHLGNIGMVYEELKVYDKALNYYQQALEIDQNLNNREGIGYQKSYIGSLNLATKNFTTAEKYLLEAYQIAKDIGTLDLMEYTTGKLSELYEATNNKEKAFDFYKLHITYKDSLANEENTRASIEKEMQYLYEKKAIADSIAYEKEKALNQAKIAQQQAELKAKRNQQYGLFAFSVLIIVFSIFMYNRYRVSQKQKEIIANQKQIVEQKNTEIVDSIRYAKRIQNAILPAVETINNQLPESFVLYMPKDIVSGDFYWMESLPLTPSEGGETEKDRMVLFATADCTGHGVPGALVSVVCANALSKALLETSPPHPALLLNKTREIVINHFDKSGEDVKDGMDIALCSLRFNVLGSRLNSPQTSNMEHKTTAVLQYAGANNPLWIIRKASPVLPKEEANPRENHPQNKGFVGESSSPSGRTKSSRLWGEHLRKSGAELIEIKPDKQPIGKHFRNEPYTHHEINLQTGDTLYIFTDGYADQFGGPKGKKFMYKQFKELLLSIYDKSMDEQKQLLYQAFNAWKGDLEQVDDVCVIGVRV